MVYLNNASTTEINKDVIKDFMWCAKNIWHNPSDVSQEGFNSKNIIKEAQIKIASVINANPEEIVFTSGASEANNWAIKGYLDRHPGVKTIITTKTEHPSVLNTCRYMESKGYKVYYAPVDNYGRVNIQKLKDMIVNNNLLNSFVSIMMANNEIGSLNDIETISKVVHKYGCVLHVDAVQAFMHTEIDVDKIGVDMMSTSFHKFGGFKNCGFLYIKNGIELTPLIHGGSQFDNKRAGTENIPMIYAIGNHIQRLNDDMFVILERTKRISKYIINQVYDRCGDLCNVYLNGHPSKKIHNNLSFTFEGINASNLITLLELREIYVSAGSACCSGEKTPSRVLKAIGLSNEEAFSTIRVSINHNTTMDEVDEFVDALVECIESLKIMLD